MTPYYEDSAVTIYHGDCREILPHLEPVDLVLTDPPYGIDYQSGWDSPGGLQRSIQCDKDTSLRDYILRWHKGAALVFGTWKVEYPNDTRQILIWDTKGALGMGALDLPWKPSHQQIYVLGNGFEGYRGSDVLSYPPVQSTTLNGRQHPHEKPIALIRALLRKCPSNWVVCDPCTGVGTILRAAKDLGRKAIGIEIEEKYCEIAAKRMSQEVLQFAAGE